MRRPARMILVALASSFLLSISASSPASAVDEDGWYTNLGPKPRPSAAVNFQKFAIITADKARVWEILTDFAHYQDWNPWVTHAEGVAEPGATIRVWAFMGGIELPFQQRITSVEHEKELCWEDSSLHSWFVSAHRCSTLETLSDGRVLLKQDVAIDGGLIEVAEFFMGESLRNGVAAEVAALKTHAER